MVLESSPLGTGCNSLTGLPNQVPYSLSFWFVFFLSIQFCSLSHSYRNWGMFLPLQISGRVFQWTPHSVVPKSILQPIYFSIQEGVILHPQSSLLTLDTSLCPTPNPLPRPLTAFPKDGGQTSNPRDFLTAFAHITMRSSHCYSTMSPRAVVTQEISCQLWCLPVDGKPSPNRPTGSSVAWRVRALWSARFRFGSEFLTPSGPIPMAR